MNRAPVFFISHGAPSFALDPGHLGARLRDLGRRLTTARAVVVISPHWQTAELCVMTTAEPPTLHDFSGFSAALYELRYPAKGHPTLARETTDLLAEAGFSIFTDQTRGLDHGAWVPLLHLFPQADVPVFQVSLPFRFGTCESHRLGKALRPLRERGVIILASGSLTHNLHDIQWNRNDTAPYVEEFTSWVRATMSTTTRHRLSDYRTLAPHAVRAHPTEEHFLPLLVASGAAMDEEETQLIDRGVSFGVLSMESYVWG